jgi:NADH:ubiquinone oxidoreductase subunit C
VTGWPDTVADILGCEVADDYGTVRVDVSADAWVSTLTACRDRLGCVFFDWLTAVDERPDGFRLVCHLVAPPTAGAPLQRLMVRTLLAAGQSGNEASVGSAVEVYAGAAWHEREVAEMFGVAFGDPAAEPARLLLPAGFQGRPLRKDFVLASRVAVTWPGAKEPGESDASLAESPPPVRRTRRRARPPGVPTVDEWGPREPDGAGS